MVYVCRRVRSLLLYIPEKTGYTIRVYAHSRAGSRKIRGQLVRARRPEADVRLAPRPPPRYYDCQLLPSPKKETKLGELEETATWHPGLLPRVPPPLSREILFPLWLLPRVSSFLFARDTFPTYIMGDGKATSRTGGNDMRVCVTPWRAEYPRVPAGSCANDIGMAGAVPTLIISKPKFAHEVPPFGSDCPLCPTTQVADRWLPCAQVPEPGTGHEAAPPRLRDLHVRMRAPARARARASDSAHLIILYPGPTHAWWLWKGGSAPGVFLSFSVVVSGGTFARLRRGSFPVGQHGRMPCAMRLMRAAMSNARHGYSLARGDYALRACFFFLLKLAAACS